MSFSKEWAKKVKVNNFILTTNILSQEYKFYFKTNFD
jgi:hypothetical protein